jgi:putative inorganic carbon (HCO3(-)) transporter
VFIASLAAYKPVLALTGIAERAGRFEGFITLFFYGVLFIAAKNHLQVKRKNVMFFLTVQSIVALYAILQFYKIDPLVTYLNYQVGTYSTIGNQNFLGSFCVTLLILSSGLFLMDRKPTTLLIAAIFFGGFLASNTRGCWVAFAVIFVLSLVLLFKKRFIGGYFTLLFSFYAVFLLMNYTNQNHLVGRAKSIEYQITVESETAGSGRVQIWYMSKEAILANPIFGTGPENLKEYFFQSNNERFNIYGKRTGKTVDKAHSEVLHIMAVSGIPAALVYLSFLIVIYWKNRKFILHHNSTTILAFAVSTYLVQGLFNISVIAVAPLFWILLGVYARGKPIQKEDFFSH